MFEEITPNEMLAKDRLLSRPNTKPLPTCQDPKAPRGGSVDPKEELPAKGRGIDPKAGDIDYTA